MNFALAVLVIAATFPVWRWLTAEFLEWWDHRHDWDLNHQVRTNPERRALRAIRR